MVEKRGYIKKRGDLFLSFRAGISSRRWTKGNVCGGSKQETEVGWQCHRVCFVIGFVCFKRKLTEKHQQLEMLRAYSLPLLLGYDKNSCPVMRRACWDAAAPWLFTPSRGTEGFPYQRLGSAELPTLAPPAQFRPVISLDFDLMQQLLVMWFEGDKCPVQGWLALTLISLMMREQF